MSSLEGKHKFYQTNACVMQGGSGGALANSFGEIVGLISNNHAIVSKEKRTHLQRLGNAIAMEQIQ